MELKVIELHLPYIHFNTSLVNMTFGANFFFKTQINNCARFKMNVNDSCSRAHERLSTIDVCVNLS